MRRTTVILHLVLTASLLLMGFGAPEGWGISSVYGAPKLQSGPELSVGTGLTAQPGGTVSVPINFSTGGAGNIGSTTFTIQFDTTCLAFNTTDANNDGVPDAMVFNPGLPGIFAKTVLLENVASGQINVALFAFSPSATLPSLTPLVTLTFSVICTPAGASQNAAITFPPNTASFGSTAGQSVPGSTVNGAVTILGPTPTPTATTVPPTATSTNTTVPPTATSTNTAVPPTATATNTSVPPTATATATATPTTDVPPLFTNTPTATPVPQDPTLIIADVAGQSGSQVTVPIEFQAGDEGVVSFIFSVDYDETCLSFDATDANNDGVPDAVTVSAPGDYTVSVLHSAADTDGELDFAIADVSPPLTPVGDTNPFVTITFTVDCAPVGTSQVAPVVFSADPEVSFGSTLGGNVDGVAVDGSVTVAPVPPTNTPTTVPPTVTPTDVPPTVTPTEEPTVPPTVTPTVTPSHTPTPEVCTPMTSLLQNPSFEMGTDHWEFYTSGSGYFTTVMPGYECDKAAEIHIDQRGNNIQLYQTGFLLEPNTDYVLSFAAKSNTGNDMGVFIQEHDDDYTNYGLRQRTVDLTTGWQEFSYTFTTKGFNQPVTDSRIRFWFVNDAQIGDIYMIDKVILQKADGSTPTPTPTPQAPTPTPTPTGVCTPMASILTNPSFENGTGSWEFYTSSSGFWNQTSDAYECDYAANVSVTEAGENVQLYQFGFSLQANTRYRLSFAAKSSTGNDMGVYIQEHDDDFTNYGLSVRRVDLGSGWQEYSYEFTTKNFSGSVNDARIRFWFAQFGQAGDVYMIDKVVLETVGAATAAGEEENPTNIYLPDVQNQ